MIQALKDYIDQFPGLDGDKVSVDRMGKEDVEYNVSPIPNTKLIEEDVTGVKTMSYQFALLLKNVNIDLAGQMENHNFFEDFSNWLSNNTEQKILPILGSGETAMSIYALNNPFMQAISDDSGVYQITCEMIYRKE